MSTRCSNIRIISSLFARTVYCVFDVPWYKRVRIGYVFNVPLITQQSLQSVAASLSTASVFSLLRIETDGCWRLRLVLSLPLSPSGGANHATRWYNICCCCGSQLISAAYCRWTGYGMSRELIVNLRKESAMVWQAVSINLYGVSGVQNPLQKPGVAPRVRGSKIRSQV